MAACAQGKRDKEPIYDLEFCFVEGVLCDEQVLRSACGGTRMRFRILL